MTPSTEKSNRSRNLWSGMFWLIAYLGVVLTGIKLLTERGVAALSRAHQDGDYGPMMLTGASILLLALTIHDFMQYFRRRDQSTEGD
jgi:high-affinity Fe2+/Pb2+ permease